MRTPTAAAPLSAHRRTWIALRHDLPASLVLLLIAIPLSLGIAVASGAPVMAGLIAAVVGSIVVGLLGGSRLQVSGPAAGLTVVVADLLPRPLLRIPAPLVAVVGATALATAFALEVERVALPGSVLDSVRFA